MTIDEAIEILGKLEKTLAPTMAADGTDAIKLGIAALRRIQYAREEHWQVCQFQLQGETKE